MSKNELQELLIKKGISDVIYEVIDIQGPEHNPLHIVKVKFTDENKNKRAFEGRARKKKDAEKNAAKNALNYYKNQNDHSKDILLTAENKINQKCLNDMLLLSSSAPLLICIDAENVPVAADWIRDNCEEGHNCKINIYAAHDHNRAHGKFAHIVPSNERDAADLSIVVDVSIFAASHLRCHIIIVSSDLFANTLKLILETKFKNRVKVLICNSGPTFINLMKSQSYSIAEVKHVSINLK